jgi:hypothetical protein
MTRIPDSRTRARRSVSGPICASRWLLVCLLGAGACLNPFPDDQPQSRDAVVGERAPVPAVPGTTGTGNPPADNGANFEDGEAGSSGNDPEESPQPDAGVATAPVIQ